MKHFTNARIAAIAMLAMLIGTSAALAEDTGISTVWDTAAVTTGDLDGTAVTISGLEDPALESVDLTGPDYSAAPLSASTIILTYGATSDWTASFSQPVGNLLLYVVFWRGVAGGPGIVTYDFDQPFTVLSGLSDAIVSNGNTRLSVPDDIYAEGIVEFTGPVSSLSVHTNADEGNFQDLTFGILPSTESTIPTLSEWGMITMAGILGLIGFMVIRRRKVTV